MYKIMLSLIAKTQHSAVDRNDVRNMCGFESEKT